MHTSCRYFIVDLLLCLFSTLGCLVNFIVRLFSKYYANAPMLIVKFLYLFCMQKLPNTFNYDSHATFHDRKKKLVKSMLKFEMCFSF